MSSAVQDLLNILDLEPLEVNLFRGRSPQVGWQRVFGGQVIGQALVAAVRTVEGRPPHSLHAYFLLPGDPKVPIIYDVDRIRDGKSFTTRRVTARQHGHPIFSMAVSFHTDEPGLDHQAQMPNVPPPEKLPSDTDMREKLLPTMPDPVRRYYERERPIELRPHRPFRADEWLLYAQDSPNLHGSRGFARGLIFKRDGTLVASVAQEGLVRQRRET